MKTIDALKKLAFSKKGFDGFLIANPANLFYLSGVQGASCLLVPKRGESTIYVYGVNYESVKEEGKGFNVELVKRSDDLMATIAGQVKARRMKKVAVDMLGVDSFHSLAKGLRGKSRLKVAGSLVWELRKVKNDEEIALMRKAGELTSLGMKTAQEAIAPGCREIEVAAEIEYAMRKKLAWGTAFETSVASGAHSAFPHGGCTEKKIRSGDAVVVDIGAKYQQYCSDMTRTFVAGKPSKKQEKVFEIVRVAQEKACQAVKPKVKARNVDAVARNSIKEVGYADCFVHGLGHGIGLEVHEPPTLSQESKDTLTVGNAVTVEPGVYLVGFGGFRIEDTVLVQKSGSEKLTAGTYTLKSG